jgi:hypothetical protein
LKVLIHLCFLLRDPLRNKSLVGRRRAAPRFRGASVRPACAEATVRYKFTKGFWVRRSAFQQ